MPVIFKYQILIADRQVIEIPRGGKIVDVAFQNDAPQPFIWVLHEKSYPEVFERVLIGVYGTGRNISPATPTFHKTIHNDPFVWHVFSDMQSDPEQK